MGSAATCGGNTKTAEHGSCFRRLKTFQQYSGHPADQQHAGIHGAANMSIRKCDSPYVCCCHPHRLCQVTATDHQRLIRMTSAFRRCSDTRCVIDPAYLLAINWWWG